MVIVYGKDNCDKCDTAIDKIKNYFGLEYEKKTASDYLEWNKDWKVNNSVNVLACYSEIQTLPVIEINGKCMSYNQAMKVFKNDKPRD